MPYRLLAEGEKIEVGDQVLDDDADTWLRIPLGSGKTVGETWVIGCKWNGRSFKPIRREIVLDGCNPENQ